MEFGGLVVFRGVTHIFLLSLAPSSRLPRIVVGAHGLVMAPLEHHQATSSRQPALLAISSGREQACHTWMFRLREERLLHRPSMYIYKVGTKLHVSGAGFGRRRRLPRLREVWARRRRAWWRPIKLVNASYAAFPLAFYATRAHAEKKWLSPHAASNSSSCSSLPQSIARFES